MKFTTSLDKLAKGITTAVTILFIILTVVQFSLMEETGGLLTILTTGLIILIYLIVFALRPIQYEVSAQQLIIQRQFGDVKIDRRQINSVEILDKDQLSMSMRTFGVGGLFGYFGKFSNTKIGSMTWYATRRDKTVLVRTKDNKKIILTPDDPGKFVAQFKS